MIDFAFLPNIGLHA